MKKQMAVAVTALVVGLAATAAAEGSLTDWLHPDVLDRIEKFIVTVGFSVFVALWFMFRAEKRLDEGNRLQTEQIRLLKKLLGEKED